MYQTARCKRGQNEQKKRDTLSEVRQIIIKNIWIWLFFSWHWFLLRAVVFGDALIVSAVAGGRAGANPGQAVKDSNAGTPPCGGGGVAVWQRTESEKGERSSSCVWY